MPTRRDIRCPPEGILDAHQMTETISVEDSLHDQTKNELTEFKRTLDNDEEYVLAMPQTDSPFENHLGSGHQSWKPTINGVTYYVCIACSIRCVKGNYISYLESLQQ